MSRQEIFARPDLRSGESCVRPWATGLAARVAADESLTEFSRRTGRWQRATR